MKKIKLLSLLLIVTLVTQNASADLPYSSHYQGSHFFNVDGVSGHVDFAVYDTLAYGGDWNEWLGAGFDPPGDGQYIYAYQIFSDEGSTDAIELFTIMGLDDHKLTGVNTMTYQDPWEDYFLTEEGIAPTGTDFSIDETYATWEFAGSIFVEGEYSWFLIFSSAYNWVEGKYEITTTNSFPVPPETNPEPCTLVLLGLGSTILLAKRSRVRSHN